MRSLLPRRTRYFGLSLTSSKKVMNEDKTIQAAWRRKRRMGVLR